MGCVTNFSVYSRTFPLDNVIYHQPQIKTKQAVTTNKAKKTAQKPISEAHEFTCPKNMHYRCQQLHLQYVSHLCYTFVQVYLFVTSG